MSIDLILLLVCPILLATLAKARWRNRITWKEYALILGSSVAIVALVYALGSYSQFTDTEVLNGQVVGKARVEVSCKHSYSCNCRPVPTVDTKGNTTLTTVCDTCYEHDHDYDWNVETSLNKDIRIARIDRQGIHEPPRWSRAHTGEPVAMKHSYINYVKAASDSLFHEAGAIANTRPVPGYPLGVYDYYKLDRVINDGLPISGSDLSSWSAALSEDLKTIGPARQANIVLLLTKAANQEFAYAVKKSWQGAKKNDIVVVIGMPSYPKIDWVNVFSWSSNSMVNVFMRDDVASLQTFDFNKVREAIKTNSLKYFKRKPMKEFAYLKYEVDPPTWVMVIAWILSLGIPIGLIWYSYNNDIFGDEPIKWPRR